MPREQRIARFFFCCIGFFLFAWLVIGWLAIPHRFTFALLSSSVIWSIGLVLFMMPSFRRAAHEIIADERDLLISYRATFAGGVAGYMALFIGIIVIHSKFAMNGIFTMPVDTLYILFSLVLLTFGTVRELAVLIYYRLSQ